MQQNQWFWFLDFFGYGKWVTGCGRVFLLSNRNVRTIFLYHVNKYKYYNNQGTWQEAQRFCYSIGMFPLAIEYDDKDVCLSTLMAS